MNNSAPYEARYGWTGKTVRVVLVCVVFLALAVGGSFVPGNPVWLGVVIGVFALTGLATMVGAAVSHALALRVDASGVALGGSPLRRNAPATEVPWQDVAAIVLWTQDLGLFNQKMHYAGVHLKSGVPPLPMSARMRRVSAALVPNVPTDVVRASVAINGWRLDRDRLEAAVAAFGGGVEILDLTEGSRTTAKRPPAGPPRPQAE